VLVIFIDGRQLCRRGELGLMVKSIEYTGSEGGVPKDLQKLVRGHSKGGLIENCAIEGIGLFENLYARHELGTRTLTPVEAIEEAR